jgi:hypothetical protein
MEDTSYVVNQVPPMSLWGMEASRKRPTELRIRCWTGLSGQANFAAGMGLVALWPCGLNQGKQEWSCRVAILRPFSSLESSF